MQPLYHMVSLFMEQNSISAQFIYRCLSHWVQSNVRSQGSSMVFGDARGRLQCNHLEFQINHFTEFRTFACCQSFCFFFRQGLGVFVIFFCAFDHFRLALQCEKSHFCRSSEPTPDQLQSPETSTISFFDHYVNPFTPSRSLKVRSNHKSSVPHSSAIHGTSSPFGLDSADHQPSWSDFRHLLLSVCRGC